MFSDTLHRHELSHHAPGNEGGNDQTHRITVRTFRACFSCAIARVRCSGGDPCGRCDTRSLRCQYPTERRSKARINNGVSRRLSGIDELLQLEPQASRKPSEIPINGFGDPHASPKKSFDTFSSITKTHFGDTSTNESGSGTGATSTQLYHASLKAASAPDHLQFGVRQNGDCRDPHRDVSNSGPLVFSGPSLGICAEMKSLQSDMASSGVDIDMNTTGNANMALEFDTSLLDQSMLSTINWLPNELLDGARSEGPLSENVSSQPSHHALPDAYVARGVSKPPVIKSDHFICKNISQTPPGYHSIGSHSTSLRRPSHSESVDSSKRLADYHVDDGCARLPKYRKQHTLWPTSSVDTIALAEGSSGDDDGAQNLGFPPLHDMQVDNISEEVMRKMQPLQQHAYDEIHENFLMLCHNKNPFFETFESESFPSAETCTQYLACFFDSFQTVYPIFHLPTFDPNQCHWLVTIAVAAIGCHSSGIREVNRCTAAFHEMIRRAIFAEVKFFLLFFPPLSGCSLDLFSRRKSMGQTNSLLTTFKRCYSTVSGFFIVEVNGLDYLH